jgi:hypothetical protein
LVSTATGGGGGSRRYEFCRRSPSRSDSTDRQLALGDLESVALHQLALEVLEGAGAAAFGLAPGAGLDDGRLGHGGGGGPGEQDGGPSAAGEHEGHVLPEQLGRAPEALRTEGGGREPRLEQQAGHTRCRNRQGPGDNVEGGVELGHAGVAHGELLLAEPYLELTDTLAAEPCDAARLGQREWRAAREAQAIDDGPQPALLQLVPAETGDVVGQRVLEELLRRRPPGDRRPAVVGGRKGAVAAHATEQKG